MTVQTDYEKFLKRALPGLQMGVGRDIQNIGSFHFNSPDESALRFGACVTRDGEFGCIKGGANPFGVAVRVAKEDIEYPSEPTTIADKYYHGETVGVLRKGYIAVLINDPINWQTIQPGVAVYYGTADGYFNSPSIGDIFPLDAEYVSEAVPIYPNDALGLHMAIIRIGRATS